MSTQIVPKITTKNEALQVQSISIIIPVFNQERKISYSLKKIKQAVESDFSNYEMIVVDDGSTDNTLTILKGVAITDEHICILSYKPNRGKGCAVRHGVLHSQGDVVMFLDCDLDICLDSIKDYVETLSTSDLVIASKRHPKSRVTVPRSRAFLSRAFNLLIKVAIGIPQKDTQAGFKAGRGDIMRTLFRNVTVKRYAFDIELFTMASILHLEVQEMPVLMRIDSRFNAKEIANMFVDVVRIWYRYRIAHSYHLEHLNNEKNNG